MEECLEISNTAIRCSRDRNVNNNATKDSPTSCVNGEDEANDVGILGPLEPNEGESNSVSPPKSLHDDSDHSSPGSPIRQERKRQRQDSSYQSPNNDSGCLFDYLSDEVLIYIFSLVPRGMLPILSLVCKRFRDLCLDESFWTRYDLSFRMLPEHTMSYVVTRGVRALRCNSVTIMSPIFDPSQPFPDGYTFKIEYLDLSSADISAKDLGELLSRCHSLKKLSIESCEVNDRICDAIAQNANLDTLNMAMCNGLSASGLRTVVSSCPLLESVNISWCNLTDEAVSEFCRNVSPNLLSVNFAGSLRSLCNEDIEMLVCRCPELSNLDISDCIKITGQVMDSIMESADNLQTLSISRSYKISTAAVMQLKLKASLCTINMFGNSMGNMFSSQHMKYIKASLPGVTINKEMMSSIARPTVGIRRTSIWGVRCRN